MASSCLYYAVVLVVFGTVACTRGGVNGLVWPVSGTQEPDLPQSSPFGPRLKASEGYRFDFHRGVDIPTPHGSPVYAIADGKIRLAGNYSFYSDTVIQVTHSGDLDNYGTVYYANYLHMHGIGEGIGEDVEVGEGQLLGYTGASVSGFEHLHFEIRNGSVYQQFNVNPWGLLPYTDTVDGHTVVVTSLNCSQVPDAPAGDEELVCAVGLRASQLAGELDLNRLAVRLLDETGEAIPGANASYDFAAINAATDDVASLDNAWQGDVWVWPATFSSQSTAPAEYNVVFSNVRVGAAQGGVGSGGDQWVVRGVAAAAIDVKGNEVNHQLTGKVFPFSAGSGGDGDGGGDDDDGGDGGEGESDDGGEDDGVGGGHDDDFNSSVPKLPSPSNLLLATILVFAGIVSGCDWVR